MLAKTLLTFSVAALLASVSTASADNRAGGRDPNDMSPDNLFAAAVFSQVHSRVCPSAPMNGHEALQPLRDLYGQGITVGWKRLTRDFGEISNPDMLAANTNLLRASLYSGRPVEELVIEASILTDLIASEYEKAGVESMMTLCTSAGYDLEPFATLGMNKAPIQRVTNILENLKVIAAQTSDAFKAKDKCGLSDDVMQATDLLIENHIAWSNLVTMRGTYGIELWTPEDQEEAWLRRFNTTSLPPLCERHVAALSHAESNPRLIHKQEE